MDDLYRELIIDRYKNPRYRGELDPHDIMYEDDNPLCGDHIRIELRVDENNIVTEAAFTGRVLFNLASFGGPIAGRGDW